MEISQLILRIYLVCVPITAVADKFHKWQLPRIWNSLCDTENCHKLGKIFALNLNPNGNPCNNFYDFACRNWEMHNPLEGGTIFDNSGTMLESMNLRTMLAVKNLLESSTNTTQDFERAQAFHRVCTNIQSLGRSDPNVVANIMKNVGGIQFMYKKSITAPPQFTYWEIDQKYLKIAGESAFFDVKLERVGIAPFTALTAPVSAYGSLVRLPGWLNRNELQHYENFLISLSRGVGGYDDSIPRNVILNDVRDVIRFREKLDMVISEFGFNGKMDRMSIKLFQALYNEQVNYRAIPQINWLEVIRSTYKNPHEAFNITDTTMIFVNSLYINNMSQLLQDTPGSIIANHIHLYFAERHVTWNSDMKGNLMASVKQYGPRLTGTIRNELPRWQDCIELNPMQAALGKAYTSAYFSKEDKLKVQTLFEIAKELLQQEISKSSWLDPATKQKTKDTVNKISSVIGYPDFYDSDRPQIFKLQSVNPIEQEIHYTAKLNRITASAASLQWPYYTANTSFVIDYGTTVSMFGHELQHAVNNNDLMINGSEKASGWPKEMIAEHRRRINCFKQQYRNYKKGVYENWRDLVRENLTFTETVEEDVADVMGLKLAYLGYRQELKKHNGICQVLPYMHSFSCEQLFFLAFANLFCARLSPSEEEIALFTETHSLPQIRVNGAVASVKEFSEAYNCHHNDPLHYTQTCDYWNP